MYMIWCPGFFSWSIGLELTHVLNYWQDQIFFRSLHCSDLGLVGGHLKWKHTRPWWGRLSPFVRHWWTLSWGLTCWLRMPLTCPLLLGVGLSFIAPVWTLAKPGSWLTLPTVKPCYTAHLEWNVHRRAPWIKLKPCVMRRYPAKFTLLSKRLSHCKNS